MAIQSYADIMARLNNPYGTMTEQPRQTVADDFTKYVQTLLLDTNPQGGMLDRDPFRRQNEIDARIKQEQEAQAAKAAQTAGVGGGMFGGSSSGGSDSGNNVQLTKEQLAFLENETLDQRGERLKRDWLGLKPIAGMLLDPLGTFLTYPKQEATPNLGIGKAKTPYQIFMENWEKTLPADIQVARNIQKAQMESQAALANSGWNPEGTQYTSSYGTTTDSGNISAAEASGLSSARESFGYGSNADYYGD